MRISIHLPEEVETALQVRASKEKRSRSAMAAVILSDALDNAPDKHGKPTAPEAVDLDEMDRLVALDEKHRPGPLRDSGRGDCLDSAGNYMFDANTIATSLCFVFLRNNAAKLSAELRALRALTAPSSPKKAQK